jgi:hypothetical protein
LRNVKHLQAEATVNAIKVPKETTSTNFSKFINLSRGNRNRQHESAKDIDD